MIILISEYIVVDKTNNINTLNFEKDTYYQLLLKLLRGRHTIHTDKKIFAFIDHEHQLVLNLGKHPNEMMTRWLIRYTTSIRIDYAITPDIETYSNLINKPELA
jgi:hypothetical protein